MDTSETYIKMCEKAGEIQVIYSKDFTVRYTPDNAGYLVDSKFDYLYRHKLGDIPIWLPRQDQLQEMLSRETQTDITSWDERGWDVFRENGYEDFVGGKISWEQIWLTFVMKEKHNKVWNGEDWIKEGL